MCPVHKTNENKLDVKILLKVIWKLNIIYSKNCISGILQKLIKMYYNLKRTVTDTAGFKYRHNAQPNKWACSFVKMGIKLSFEVCWNP